MILVCHTLNSDCKNKNNQKYRNVIQKLIHLEFKIQEIVSWRLVNHTKKVCYHTHLQLSQETTLICLSDLQPQKIIPVF